MTWVAKKAFAKVAVQVAVKWVGDCQMNGWQFLDWWNFLGLKTGGWWGGWHYSGDREGGGGCYAIATAASGATGHFPPTPSHLLRLFIIWLLSLVKILNIVFFLACMS